MRDAHDELSSVEGAKGNFASAEATKGLCDRPLETFAP